MGEQSTYTTVDIYADSRNLVLSCYALTQGLPIDEKSNLVYYIRNSALAAHFALLQGLFAKKKKATKTHLQEATNAYVVIDAAVDVLVDLQFVKEEQTLEVLKLASVLYQLTVSLQKEN